MFAGNEVLDLLVAQWPIWTVTIVLIVAAVIDGIQLKVPNWITYPLIGSGWIYSAVAYWIAGESWMIGLGWSLLGTAVGLGLLLPAYAVGGMGAGDVKLLAGIGAWIHATDTAYAFAVSAVIGGVIALGMVGWKKAWSKHSQQFVGILDEFRRVRDPEKLAMIAAERKSRMFLLPYGIPIAIGLAVFALSTLPIYWIDIDTSFETLAGWTAVSRIGMGLIFPSLTTGSLRVLSRELLAQGSGAINFVRQLGGAFGVNLLAIFLERRTLLHADAFTASQTSDNAATMQFLNRFVDVMKTAGLPDFQQMPAALDFLGQTIVLQANTLAFRDGFLVVTLIFIAALAPTWVLYRATRGPQP